MRACSTTAAGASRSSSRARQGVVHPRLRLHRLRTGHPSGPLVRNGAAPRGFAHHNPWPLGEIHHVQTPQNRVRVGGVSLSTTHPR